MRIATCSELVSSRYLPASPGLPPCAADAGNAKGAVPPQELTQNFPVRTAVPGRVVHALDADFRHRLCAGTSAKGVAESAGGFISNMEVVMKRVRLWLAGLLMVSGGVCRAQEAASPDPYANETQEQKEVVRPVFHLARGVNGVRSWTVKSSGLARCGAVPRREGRLREQARRSRVSEGEGD